MEGELRNIRYGRLVTTGNYESRHIGKNHKKYNRFLECVCDCGKLVWINKYSLTSGTSKSCGCLNRETLKKRSINISGYEFNGCIVIDRTLNVMCGRVSKTAWNCLCHCGNKFISTTEHIKEGTIISCGCKRWRKGSESPNWISELNNTERSRDNSEYKKWRFLVYKRDNFTCQICNITKVKLNAHHIMSYSRFNDLKFNLDNGVTLCECCHKEFHSKYSKKEFTAKDYYEFKLNKK